MAMWVPSMQPIVPGIPVIFIKLEEEYGEIYLIYKTWNTKDMVNRYLFKLDYN